ncbi:SRPBCC family protein [Streptacidiphilus cavernicola]|uniref:SRPBCC domain-containing protein n=1 Tax=Streptacidiphilus cavernicola TaxID=3342716 RepID=A0ABV6W2U9_9ACTN
MSDTAAPTEGFTLTRVFDAPRELVFRAWTDPAQFAAWFGATSRVPLETLSMDVRPGGAWRAIMHVDQPEPMELLFHGDFREVVEPERLVLTLKNPADADDPKVELVTVVLKDLGDGRTEMQFEQLGHLGAEEYVRTRHGWSAFFDVLAEGLPTAG